MQRGGVLPRPRTVGEWLSLVEHLVRDQGVGGSNPLSPTNLNVIRSVASVSDREQSLFCSLYFFVYIAAEIS